MENKENQSSIATLLSVLRRKGLWMLFYGVLLAVATALVTVFLISPVYSSTAKYYVYSDNRPNDSISSQEINAAQSLVSTYIEIIKSNSVLQKTAESAGLDVTPQQIRKMITAGSLSGTEAFYLKVSSTSREDALRLSEAFAEVLPSVIPDVIKAGGVSVFDEPVLAEEPDSPSLVLNSAIGFLLGLLISFLVYFLSEMLDNTIYAEEDLKKNFQYPVIGLIPTISVENGEKTSGRARRRKNTQDAD